MAPQEHPFLFNTGENEYEISTHHLFRNEDGKSEWRVVKCRIPHDIVRNVAKGTDSFAPKVTGGTISASGKRTELTGVEIIKSPECRLFMSKVLRREGFHIKTGEMVVFENGKDLNAFLKKEKLGLVLDEDGAPYLDNEDLAAQARLEKSQVAMQLVAAMKEAGLTGKRAAKA